LITSYSLHPHSSRLFLHCLLPFSVGARMQSVVTPSPPKSESGRVELHFVHSPNVKAGLIGTCNVESACIDQGSGVAASHETLACGNPKARALGREQGRRRA